MVAMMKRVNDFLMVGIGWSVKVGNVFRVEKGKCSLMFKL